MADAVDTSGWILVEDNRLPVRTRMPNTFHFRVRELPPLVINDPGVARVELAISQVSFGDRTPLPAHSSPDTNIVLNVVFLPPPFQQIRFGPMPSPSIEATTVRALGAEVQVTDLPADDFGPRRVVVQANLETDEGILHINGMALPGEDDAQVSVLLGLVKSMEAAQ